MVFKRVQLAAIRYEETARNYLSMMKLGCIRFFSEDDIIQGCSLAQSWACTIRLIVVPPESRPDSLLPISPVLLPARQPLCLMG